MFSVIETCYPSRIYCMRKVLWAVLFASQLFSSCRQKVIITEKMAFPQEKRIQAVIDYISGMTDVYALDLYRKINGMSLPAL